ncbi:Uncharacterised protein [Chlamydia abortus]|nr:Uncharacterised protein [Chlamydia abortus]
MTQGLSCKIKSGINLNSFKKGINFDFLLISFLNILLE